MVNRIKDLATHWHLSPTAFADRIEIARPIVSHIFSGRNKPSLEVVQKIGAAFPEVDLNWLLYGKGEMLKNIVTAVSSEKVTAPVPESNPAKPIPPVEKMAAEKVQKATEPKPVVARQPAEPKKIVKVMFFYADHTFEAFEPQ